MGKKLLTIAGVIIAVIWVVNNPHGAAADVRHLIAALSAFATTI
jgi:hypothetical protein